VVRDKAKLIRSKLQRNSHSRKKKTDGSGVSPTVVKPRPSSEYLAGAKMVSTQLPVAAISLLLSFTKTCRNAGKRIHNSKHDFKIKIK